MAYAAWNVVYSEQPSQAKWQILGTNDAHFYSFLGDNLVWQDWTPSYVGFTPGDGTLTFAKYTKVGRTVHARWMFICGSTSAFSAAIATVSLPVAIISGYPSNCLAPLGHFNYNDVSGNGFYPGTMAYSSTTAARMVCFQSQGTGLEILLTSVGNTPIPLGIGNGDILSFGITYEAAL